MLLMSSITQLKLLTIFLRNKMPTIKILNRDYQVNCGPGEEQKLLDLAATLDKRLRESEKIFKGANENLLIVLTALILEDQNQDLKNKLEDSVTKIEELCTSLEIK